MLEQHQARQVSETTRRLRIANINTIERILATFCPFCSTEEVNEEEAIEEIFIEETVRSLSINLVELTR